jgi:hypothetical protein
MWTCDHYSGWGGHFLDGSFGHFAILDEYAGWPVFSNTGGAASRNFQNETAPVPKLLSFALGSENRGHPRAKVGYIFQKDILVGVSAIFTDESSQASYDAIQQQLAAEYGPMPTPNVRNDCWPVWRQSRNE